MKYKIFLSLFTALFVLFSGVSLVNAENQSGVLEIQEQIRILMEKIKYLQDLIEQIKLQNRALNTVLAESYLLLDISNGSVISEKNAQKVYPIASITKLMNAVIAVENIDLSRKITLTEEILRPIGYSPSLFLGLSVSAENLLKASLIQSTNDAAHALSYFIGNAKFISLMNQKAKELGMNNTHFYDVHGLNPKNQSSASDIAKLVSYVYKNHPNLLDISKNNDFWLPDPTGRMLKFQNVNNFHSHPDFIGGKTGYLPEAKQSLASLFNLNGKTVALIILRSPNRQADVLKIIDWQKSNINISFQN